MAYSHFPTQAETVTDTDKLSTEPDGIPGWIQDFPDQGGDTMWQIFPKTK